MTDNPSSWTMLPVPTDQYLYWSRLVADRQIERGGAPYPATADIIADVDPTAGVKLHALDEQPEWSASALAHLAEDTTLTARRWAVVMDLCAGTPETFHSTQEVANMTELSVNEWRDACRKFGMRLNNHYPDAPRWELGPYAGSPAWPLVALSGRQLLVYDQLYVAATTAAAEAWKSVR